MKKILIIHPSRGRPKQARKILETINTNASGENPITYIFCLDSDDATVLEYQDIEKASVNVGPSTSNIEAANRVYSKELLAAHDICAIASDDIYFPENWDTAIIAVLDQVGYDKIIKTTNQFQGDHNLLNLQIGGAQFFINYGTFYWPEYITMYADTDMTMFAQQHGYYVEARHLLFPHMQYSLSMPPEITNKYGPIPGIDATYERENRAEAYIVGQRIIDRRRGEGFPPWQK